MELRRFYTGYVSSAIPPHRYPQVYNIRIGGKRRRRRSNAADSGPYSRQKPSKSSPLAQVHSVSFLDLNFEAEDEDDDMDMEVDTASLDSGIELDFVSLQNPWPESQGNSVPQTSYEGNNISLAHQTEARGQVYLPFQSCSDLSSTLAESEPDPATPPGLEEATSTIVHLCNELEYIAKVLLPKTISKIDTKTMTKSRSLDHCIPDPLAESIIEVSFPKSGTLSLFDGEPFSELPPGDTVSV
ncbi:hypothetical protein D9758_005518 [Tetrapyrgos nigripes]|uniref:Uncharacterized protein n=1 Tax=Tetrapyrgos nigripes TaxID=182062 RepID=A0A8H5LPH0_9AGAR|nr:hypothetical protein D9758_005518 [Tetrapyrgos nigripes]